MAQLGLGHHVTGQNAERRFLILRQFARHLVQNTERAKRGFGPVTSGAAASETDFLASGKRAIVLKPFIQRGVGNDEQVFLQNRAVHWEYVAPGFIDAYADPSP